VVAKAGSELELVTPERYFAPDLGLEADKAGELWVRVQHLRNRWKPMTDDPDNLTRELYELFEWLLSEEPPGPGLIAPNG
jgi:hypothetical protein